MVISCSFYIKLLLPGVITLFLNKNDDVNESVAIFYCGTGQGSYSVTDGLYGYVPRDRVRFSMFLILNLNFATDCIVFPVRSLDRAHRLYLLKSVHCINDQLIGKHMCVKTELFVTCQCRDKMKFKHSCYF